MSNQKFMDKRTTVCLCHDTERGWGHLDVDPEYAELANRRAPKDLETMLEIEREFEVKLTYHVVACFLSEVKERIEDDGHYADCRRRLHGSLGCNAGKRT